MELMEMAKLVGLAIKESEEGKRAEEMKKAYEEDEKIVALTTEFDVQQKALAAMVGNENADNNLTEASGTVERDLRRGAGHRGV